MRACSGGRGSVRSAAKRHRVAVRSGCAAGAGQSRPGTPGPHQQCCAGPTGGPARQGRTSSAVQAPQEPPHARAAPAVLCRPHRNPRTPGPHQQCCAGPTATPARQGRTSSAVQAPQKPPHARAEPAVLCRPHGKQAAPPPRPRSCGSGARRQIAPSPVVGERRPEARGIGAPQAPNRWSLHPAPPPRLRHAQVGSPSPPQRGRAPG